MEDLSPPYSPDVSDVALETEVIYDSAGQVGFYSNKIFWSFTVVVPLPGILKH